MHQELGGSLYTYTGCHQRISPSLWGLDYVPCYEPWSGQCGRQQPCQECRTRIAIHGTPQCALSGKHMYQAGSDYSKQGSVAYEETTGIRLHALQGTFQRSYCAPSTTDEDKCLLSSVREALPWTALNPVFAEPNPSTVTTLAPSRVPTGQRQALMHLVVISGFPCCSSCTCTEQDPQPPSPQALLVPCAFDSL